MKKIILLLSILSLISCTEHYALESKNYEEAIVIEALITNEVKFQEIKISKTYSLDSNSPEQISNAIVYIIDNLGNTYNFVESNSKYISQIQFAAENSRQYKLFIETENGDKYESESVKFNLSQSNFSSISYELTTKNGVSGIQFYVNSQDNTNNSKYYRFDYEETFKIVAPRWVSVKGQPNLTTQTLDLIPWDYESHICFNSYQNKNILIDNSLQSNQDAIKFPIRFLGSNDPKIGTRYSIKAYQYILSSFTHNFYEKLKAFSESNTLLSQVQPGQLSSNIISKNNSNKIIGIFDVCSVSSKRIFVNYSDLYPNNYNYPYFCDCSDNVKSPPLKYCYGSISCDATNINSSLANRILTYYSVDADGYYFFPAKCGDCTNLGTNITPSFWID